jgi:hypothetical protein
MTTPGSRRFARWLFGRHARLRFTHAAWAELLEELGRRGQGDRESGAFLLAERTSDRRTIRSVVYVDDLDPRCLTGGISFNGARFGALWDICDRDGLTVVADVHTHPNTWVGQSGIDEDNPMIARRGHLAIIVPDFSTKRVGADAIGVHEYLGDDGWRSSFGRDAKCLVYIGRFA